MIPIGDSVRSRTIPYVNIAIILINFAVFFYELSLSNDAIRASIGGARVSSELDRFIFHWANIPACTFDAVGWSQHLRGTGSAVCAQQPHPAWTIFSAMFMHGGWLHILGNMLFLWIFGDNVEDAMGHVRYAIFYLLVGVLASIAHGYIATSGAFGSSGDALQPALGASGAIAGVMGAYIVLFPRATVAVIIPIIFFIPFPLPAFVLIGFWFLLQVFSGVSSLGVDAIGAGGGVAYFAHIGGFIAGAILVNLFVRNRTRAKRQQQPRPQTW